MIPAFVAKLFPADVRSRGAEYYASRKVRIAKALPGLIQALVKGTHQYVVNIEARDDELHLTCTCPYAVDWGVCKHLWAVLCHTNADGALARVIRTAGAKPRVVVSDDNADDDVDEDDYEFEEEDYEFEDDDDALAGADGYTTEVLPVGTLLPRKDLRQRVVPPPIPEWRRALQSVHQQMQYLPHATSAPVVPEWPANRRLVYIVDLEATIYAPGLSIDIGTETQLRDGSWGTAKRFSLGLPVWFAAPDAVDRHIAEMLLGADTLHSRGAARTSGFIVGARAFPTTLRAILDTGRCRMRSTRPELNGRTLRLDDGPPWKFRLRFLRAGPDSHTLNGVLARAGEEMPLSEPLLVSSEGFLIARDAVGHFDHRGEFPLLRELRNTSSIPFDGPLSDVLASLYALPRVPDVELPDDSTIAESHDNPVPSVTIGVRTSAWRPSATVALQVEFQYGPLRVLPQSTATVLFDSGANVLHHRRYETEHAAIAKLLALGAKEEWDYSRGVRALMVSRSKLTSLAFALAREKWHVLVDGVRYQAPGEFRATVKSGIDWFDLEGSVRYGEHEFPLAALLEARRNGREVVQITDDSVGLMPSDWLERLGPLLAIGERVNNSTRFRKTQASLLDALIATLPDVHVDQTFERARTELASFAHVMPADPPATFHGTLREYQREGLGWLHFLRQFGLGGCLADDMGLGKTVQVLALLDARRVQGHRPSIIVVPRSLVFNWMREAERFAPSLRVLDLSGMARRVEAVKETAADVVITTYGTLRRDAAELASIEFDYAILDEAQAIKNAATASAKACRLLRARHRLVMSGTPIENRIEELWSLLEFLNPGMLGASAKFATLARFALPEVGVADVGVSASNPDNSGRALLARALRPIILRRTKEKVASELPARIEQTLEVELEPKQRKFYEGVRHEMVRTVMDRVQQHGMQKARMHILEALLRLRQAACHPVLADPSKSALPSAKLDALIPALASIAAEGHKALVFSQFTGFLALVRERLDANGTPYEYLDGSTRDRQARVDRFQTDRACPVFLISLKAGGHGLNLTSADYVYLLDPWWNPAVEAQAIDRAHRIGQSRRVIATRLVARNTIEEKILQLQSKKRALADAILTADKGVLASIGREELELLLS